MKIVIKILNKQTLTKIFWNYKPRNTKGNRKRGIQKYQDKSTIESRLITFVIKRRKSHKSKFSSELACILIPKHPKMFWEGKVLAPRLLSVAASHTIEFHLVLLLTGTKTSTAVVESKRGERGDDFWFRHNKRWELRQSTRCLDQWVVQRHRVLGFLWSR